MTLWERIVYVGWEVMMTVPRKSISDVMFAFGCWRSCSVFVDLEKAFYRVPRKQLLYCWQYVCETGAGHLWKHLNSSEVSGRSNRWVQDGSGIISGTLSEPIMNTNAGKQERIVFTTTGVVWLLLQSLFSQTQRWGFFFSVTSRLVFIYHHCQYWITGF